MTGLELSKKYFEEYGLPMIKADFSDIENKLCFGLTGSGSECFGFDDETSTDHDFEPGFCIFLPGEDVIDRQIEFKLERAYSKLPKEFMGYSRNTFMNPVGGPRHGVIRICDYLEQKLGSKDGHLSDSAWLRIPSSALAEFVNGEIFADNLGEMTKAREYIKSMPSDIRLKRIAGNLILMAQAGQYNFMRCVKHGELAAAQMAAFEFAKACIEVSFLLNNCYAPYYKWSFKALNNLPRLSENAAYLEYLLTTPNDDEYAEQKYYVIEDIAANIIDELINQKITEASCGDLEKHAYSVNDQVSDSTVRNLSIFAAV